MSGRPDGNRRLDRGRTAAPAPMSQCIDELWRDRPNDPGGDRP